MSHGTTAAVAVGGGAYARAACEGACGRSDLGLRVGGPRGDAVGEGRGGHRID
jgi:hypothetical protein